MTLPRCADPAAGASRVFVGRRRQWGVARPPQSAGREFPRKEDKHVPREKKSRATRTPLFDASWSGRIAF